MPHISYVDDKKGLSLHLEVAHRLKDNLKREDRCCVINLDVLLYDVLISVPADFQPLNDMPLRCQNSLG